MYGGEDTFTMFRRCNHSCRQSGREVGTKVSNIRLVDGDHDIDCKIDGIGAMQLKSEYVMKA